ncbi:MAG: zinc ribbon domain-containing protein, partial [Gallionellaceae bacterium]|nr:zinc ribbon domain-containing protein [Gallionellaceae bacterium]
NAVRARIDGSRLANGSKSKGARPKTLFGGLLRCSKCGGAMIAVDKNYYGCAARKDRGEVVCVGTTVSRSAVEKRLLGTIRDDLLSPDALI